MIKRPKCPNCCSQDIKLLKTPWNIILTCFATAVALFSADIISIWWQCTSCAKEFKATSWKKEHEGLNN
jgi:hypothetical protein